MRDDSVATRDQVNIAAWAAWGTRADEALHLLWDVSHLGASRRASVPQRRARSQGGWPSAGGHPLLRREVPTEVLQSDTGSARVQRLTGSHVVPVLALDNGEVVAGSREIVAWAGANPA